MALLPAPESFLVSVSGIFVTVKMMTLVRRMKKPDKNLIHSDLKGVSSLAPHLFQDHTVKRTGPGYEGGWV